MAVMSAQERADVTADAQRDPPECPGGVTKAQLRAVIDALDGWWETTGAGLANTAIPQPQRGNLTTRQKAYLFMLVLNKKYRVL